SGTPTGSRTVAVKHAWVPVSAPPSSGLKVRVGGVIWSTSQLIAPAACALPGTASATATSANVVIARIPRSAACIIRNPQPRARESQLDGRLGPSAARLVRRAGMWSCTSMAHLQLAARAFLTTTLLAAGLALPSVAIATPPANDNYLGSTTIVN